jgi:hypothetical protein
MHMLSAELSGSKHTILLPLDTTLLLHVLPMTPASLRDVVRVLWTGKSAPETDSVRCSQFAGTLCIMLCNTYVDTTRTTNWSPSITNNSRSGRQCSLPLVRSNTRIRTHRFQSSTSNDVPWWSIRPPETGTGEDAIDIALRLTFACHFT